MPTNITTAQNISSDIYLYQLIPPISWQRILYCLVKVYYVAKQWLVDTLPKVCITSNIIIVEYNI